MKKKILALILAVLMTLTFAPSALALDGVTEDAVNVGGEILVKPSVAPTYDGAKNYMTCTISRDALISGVPTAEFKCFLDMQSVRDRYAEYKTVIRDIFDLEPSDPLPASVLASTVTGNFVVEITYTDGLDTPGDMYFDAATLANYEQVGAETWDAVTRTLTYNMKVKDGTTVANLESETGPLQDLAFEAVDVSVNKTGVHTVIGKMSGSTTITSSGGLTEDIDYVTNNFSAEYIVSREGESVLYGNNTAFISDKQDGALGETRYETTITLKPGYSMPEHFAVEIRDPAIGDYTTYLVNTLTGEITDDVGNPVDNSGITYTPSSGRLVVNTSRENIEIIHTAIPAKVVANKVTVKIIDINGNPVDATGVVLGDTALTYNPATGLYEIENVPFGDYELEVTGDFPTVTELIRVDTPETQAIIAVVNPNEFAVVITDGVVQLGENRNLNVHDQFVPQSSTSAGFTNLEAEVYGVAGTMKLEVQVKNLPVDDEERQANPELYLQDEDDVQRIKASIPLRETLSYMFDLSAYKYAKVDQNPETPFVELGQLTSIPELYAQEIILPEDLVVGNNFQLVVYRNHNGNVTKLPQKTSGTVPTTECFTLNADGTIMTIYTRKFSVYAITTKEKTQGGGGGGTIAEQYKLTFDVDGNTSVIAPLVKDAGSVIYAKDLASAHKDGYIFTGWFFNKSLTESIGESFTLDKNTIVYAGFEKSAPVSDKLNSADHFAYVIGYPDGTVRPEKNISREETAMILFRLLESTYRASILKNTNDFPDVAAERWSNEAISTLANGGLVKGDTNGNFRPLDNITRAEFATMFIRVIGVKDDATHSFTDVGGHWAEKYIATASELGFVEGYGDGTFRPDTYITRAEAMTLVNRALYRFVNEAGLHENAIIWPDCVSNSWYFYAVEEATNSHDFTRQEDGVYETWTTCGTVLTIDADKQPE